MIDTAEITVREGSGGRGSISFRREKFVPKGGPDGGDGGRGGDVIIVASSGQHMLRAFRYQRRYVAEDGHNGGPNRKAGAAGRECVIQVPVGTVVTYTKRQGREEEMVDLQQVAAQCVVAQGGRGGRGNTKFARPQNRTPLIAEDGEITLDMKVGLELRILADLALVGLPNVGKSSLIQYCSRARPTIANYPFTTIEPVLGLVQKGNKEFVLAEIPGLIEGAHSGVGLGDQFLRHTKRVNGIVHMVDGTSENIIHDYLQVRREMKLYDDSLYEKPEIVVINKADAIGGYEAEEELKLLFASRGIRPYVVSAITGYGMEELIGGAFNLLETLTPQALLGEQTGGPVMHDIIAKEPGFSLEKSEGEYVIKSSSIERMVRVIDMDDWAVQAQLWNELKRKGIVTALKNAGAKQGNVIRIGEWDLEWR